MWLSTLSRKNNFNITFYCGENQFDHSQTPWRCCWRITPAHGCSSPLWESERRESDEADTCSRSTGLSASTNQTSPGRRGCSDSQRSTICEWREKGNKQKSHSLYEDCSLKHGEHNRLTCSSYRSHTVWSPVRNSRWYSTTDTHLHHSDTEFLLDYPAGTQTAPQTVREVSYFSRHVHSELMKRTYFTLQAEAAFKERVEYLDVFGPAAQTEACRHRRPWEEAKQRIQEVKSSIRTKLFTYWGLTQQIRIIKNLKRFIECSILCSTQTLINWHDVSEQSSPNSPSMSSFISMILQMVSSARKEINKLLLLLLILLNLSMLAHSEQPTH